MFHEREMEAFSTEAEGQTLQEQYNEPSLIGKILCFKFVCGPTWKEMCKTFSSPNSQREQESTTWHENKRG